MNHYTSTELYMDAGSEELPLRDSLREAAAGPVHREIARLQIAQHEESAKIWEKLPSAYSLCVAMYPMRDQNEHGEMAEDAAEQCWAQSKRDCKRRIEQLKSYLQEQYKAIDQFLSPL